MKKRWSLVCVLLLVVGLLAGCGSQEAAEEAKKTVTVDIPRNMLGSQSDEEIVENAKAEDITVAFSDDSVTYTMTEETQQALLLGFKTQFEENLQTVLDAGDVPGLVSVSYNDAMSVFTVTVNRAQFQAQDGEDELGILYSTGTAYQLYAGTADEAIDVVVELVDQESGEHFETYSMREAFSAKQSPGDNAD
ncbi:MAG: hypothetical protein UDB11_06920 [Peptococcaceae bacterium]|nr:hypothetical protein [Peptococcaceae bacterium]